MGKAFKILWIRKNLFLGVFLFTCVFGLLCASFYPPEHEAVASVNFYPYAYDIESEQSLRENIVIDPAMFEDEKSVLLSAEMIIPIMKNNKILEHPEYDPTKRKKRLVNEWIAHIQDVLGLDEDKNQPADIRAYKQMLERIKITETPYSRIDIHVKSMSGWLAQTMANALAEAYVAQPSRHGKKAINYAAEKPQELNFERSIIILKKTSFFGIFLGLFVVYLVEHSRHPHRKISDEPS